MPDEPAGQAPAAPEAAPPPVQPSPETPSQRDGEEWDPERARNTIANLRQFERQAKAQSKELEDLRAELKKRQDAELSETERLQKQLAEANERMTTLETKRRETAVKAQVTLEATRLNVVDPDAAYRLLDTSAISYDDAGEPSNVSALMADLIKQRPYLVAGPATGAANPPRGTGDVPETDDQRRARIYGGGGHSLWDPQAASALGGGVVFDPAVNPRQRPKG